MKIFDALPKIEEIYNYIANLANRESYILSLLERAKNFFQNFVTVLSSGKTSTIFLNKNQQRPYISNSNANFDAEIIKTFKNFANDLLLNIQTKFINNDFNQRKMLYKEIMYLSPKSLLSQEINYDTICINNIGHYVIDQDIIRDQLKILACDFKEFCNKNPIQGFSQSASEQWQSLKELLTAEDTKVKYKDLIDLYKHIITIPLNQNKCESDFSLLKRMKCYTRSVMGNTMMENIMLISLGRESIPDYVHSELIDSIGNSSKKLKTLLIH